MKKKLFLTGILLCALSGRASASEVKLSGLIFADYEAATSRHFASGARTNGWNAFDIGRIYLNAGTPLSERLNAFVQLEANLNSRDNTENQVFLKQAMLEYKEIYPGARMLFGLIPAPWIGFEEGIWKHRFAAKTFMDEEGLLVATDRGVRLSGTLPHFVYDLMVSNGEGPGGRATTGNETNRYKDLTLKLTFSPFAEGPLGGLKLNAFGLTGRKMAGWPRERVVAGPSFESGRFNCMADYVATRDGKSVVTGTDTVKGAGFSAHAVVAVTEKSWVFARYDRWDPDTSLPNDAHSRIIGGIGYALADSVRISADYQTLIQEKESAKLRDQGLAFVHLEVKF